MMPPRPIAARIPGAMRLRDRLGGLRYRVWRLRGQTVVERVEGVDFIVLPKVFGPVRFRSGVVLARATRLWMRERIAPRVLDMGTGSGVAGVHAALLGARVLSVDINPEAVRCARMNAQRNRVGERMDVRLGNLFEGLDETFDLVLFNPPFFRGEPADDADCCWRGTDVFERLVEGLPRVLRRGGEALILLSTDGAGDELLDGLRGAGFTVVPFLHRRWLGEVQTVWRVS